MQTKLVNQQHTDLCGCTEDVSLGELLNCPVVCLLGVRVSSTRGDVVTKSITAELFAPTGPGRYDAVRTQLLGPARQQQGQRRSAKDWYHVSTQPNVRF
jgi:hypothetical protein